MNTRSMAHAGILTLAILIGSGALMSQARQNDDGKPAAGNNLPLSQGSLASVDMDRLYTVSGGPRRLAEQSNQIELDNARRLKSIVGVAFLDQNELGEFLNLLDKETPTDAEKTRQTALKALSDQRVDELNALRVKPEAQLTPTDKTRMRVLQEQGRYLEKVLPGIQEDLRQDQALRVETFRREQYAALRKTVAQTAKERGFAHVFDAGALVYSVNDLTPWVLKHLGKAVKNEEKQPAP